MVDTSLLWLPCVDIKYNLTHITFFFSIYDISVTVLYTKNSNMENVSVLYSVSEVLFVLQCCTKCIWNTGEGDRRHKLGWQQFLIPTVADLDISAILSSHAISTWNLIMNVKLLVISHFWVGLWKGKSKSSSVQVTSGLSCLALAEVLGGIQNFPNNSSFHSSVTIHFYLLQSMKLARCWRFQNGGSICAETWRINMNFLARLLGRAYIFFICMLALC